MAAATLPLRKEEMPNNPRSSIATWPRALRRRWTTTKAVRQAAPSTKEARAGETDQGQVQPPIVSAVSVVVNQP
jgi:hypothetical protein